MAMAQGYSRQDVRTILTNVAETDLIDDKIRSLLQLAEKITRHSYKVSEVDISKLQSDGCSEEEIFMVSAKSGMGVEEALEYLVQKIPPPEGDREAPLQALIIDSWFDNYLGVVSLVRVKQGVLRKREKVIVKSTGKAHQVDSVGIFTPKRVERDAL